MPRLKLFVNMQNLPKLNKYLQPLGSVIDKTDIQKKYTPWIWGIKQGIQVKRVRASSVNFYKLRGIQSNGTLQGTLSSGTLNNTTHTGTSSMLGTMTLQ